MSSPGKISRLSRFSRRPGGWLDFALVVLPTYLVEGGLFGIFVFVFLRPWISPNASEVPKAVSIPVQIVLLSVLILISLLRRSEALLVYWLVQAFEFLDFTCVEIGCWESWIGHSSYVHAPLILNLAWLVMRAGLTAWLIWMVLRTHENLVRVLALFPIVSFAGGLIFSSAWPPNGITVGIPWDYPVSRALDTIIPFLHSIVWAALFYLFPNRPLRWLGLLMYALPTTGIDQYIWLYTGYPWFILLSNLPLLLVVFAWAIELVQKRPKQSKTDA